MSVLMTLVLAVGVSIPTTQEAAVMVMLVPMIVVLLVSASLYLPLAVKKAQILAKVLYAIPLLDVLLFLWKMALFVVPTPMLALMVILYVLEECVYLPRELLAQLRWIPNAHWYVLVMDA